jgi:PAS domain S-box-containing protein
MVFLLKHLDYIYFFYGLSFMLLAGVCFLLDRNKDKLMPWSLLVLFGIFHGLSEWISMMVLFTGELPFYYDLKISVMLVSFVFLFEFGRTGLRAIYPKYFGGLSIAWQYGVLLMAVFSLHSFGGVDDFDTSIRYVFGFSGGMISAVLLFHYYLSETKGRYYFLVSGICLFLYAIAAGLVVNNGAFFLSHYLNIDNFQRYAGFPVQVLRCALVITLTVTLWEYCCFMRKVRYNTCKDLSFGYGKWLTTAMLAVLCCGWLLTMSIGNSVDRNQREDFMIAAEAIAAGISMENLKNLNGDMADIKTADYRGIQKYLREFEGAAKGVQCFHLMKIKGGKIYFVFDSSPETAPEFAPPGSAYADAPLELVRVFKDGKPLVLGPYSDKWGSFVSAFIPILDPETRNVHAVLGCDINSVKWAQMISISRLQPIIITLLICIILVISFLMHQASLEASMIISESEKKYRNLFNNSNDPIFILDLKGRFIEVNEMACGKLGYTRDEFLRLSHSDIASADSVDFISEKTGRLNRETQFIFEASLLAKDGKSTTAEMNAKIIDFMGGECVLCIARDLSERKKIEGVLEDIVRQGKLREHLAQSEKMEAMGKFAGGVAHDFNNVIQVVKGFSELIMMKVDRDSEISEEIEEIGKAAKRAMDITNQLLLFSRRKPANINDVDMNSLISNLNNMLIGALGENISLETVLDPALKPAKADMDLIRQVLLNLAVNAKDSMPDGGKLKIMTRNICFEEPGGASMNEAASGDFVLISVSDTGQGMTPEAKTHVFEPFFSTKPRSKGAGLGLSAVYGIVKQHNGWINVSSEPGLGTSFEIYLPALAI